MGSPLVGRRDELERARIALAEHRLVALLGEPGIGKTRLASEIAQRERAGGRVVLTGRAVETGTGTAYRPLTEALSGAVRRHGIPTDPALAAFLPALTAITPLPDLGAVAPAALDASTPIVAEGVLRLLRAYGGALLVLDDLQWADPETVAVVEYLGDNLADEPSAVVVTSRSGGGPVGAAARGVLRALAARAAAEVIALSCLSAADVAQLAAAGGRDPGQRVHLDTLVARSGGIPFHVQELLDATEGQPDRIGTVVPASYADLVATRLEDLSRVARRLAEAAAVVGGDIDAGLLAETLSVPEEQVCDALEECVASTLLVNDGRGGQLGFRHELVRDAVLAAQLPAARVRVARSAAAALQRRAGEQADPGTRLRLAELMTTAGDAEGAARQLLAAGRQAAMAGALRTAESSLLRAIDLARDGPVGSDAAESLTEVLASAGQLDAALATAAPLLSRLAVSGAEQTTRRLHTTLARAAAVATRWSEAQAQLDAARRLADDAAPEDLARLDVLSAYAAMGQGQLREAGALADRALQSAQRLSLPEVAAEAYEVLGRRQRLFDLEEARRSFERQRQVAEGAGLVLLQIRALHELGTIDMLSAARGERLTQASDLAHQSGALALAATVDLQLVSLYPYRLHADEGIRAGERCIDLAGALGLDQVFQGALLHTAMAHGMAGDLDRMEELLCRVAELAPGDLEAAAVADGNVRATALLLAERRADAAAALDRAAERVRRLGRLTPGMFHSLRALLAAVEDREVAASRADVDALAPPVQSNHGALLKLADAVAAGRAGQHATADTLAGEALEQLAPVPLVSALAQRLTAEAALADGWGDPVGWLRSTLALVEHSGHTAFAEACRSLLRRAGASAPRPGRARAQLPPALRALGVTAREAEVLALLGERRTNREIAAALVLSPRTVEKHVEHLLDKTSAGSRAELVAFARRHLGAFAPGEASRSV